jgi:nucleoside-diphosphate-sugar epimerase
MNNPFDSHATAILRPLCQALYDLNNAAREENSLPAELANQSHAFGHVYDAIFAIIEAIFPELKDQNWRHINYGGGYDFFEDFCDAANAALVNIRAKKIKTMSALKAALLEYNVQATHKDGEIRVWCRKHSELCEYFTDDLEDAFLTGVRMAS